MTMPDIVPIQRFLLPRRSPIAFARVPAGLPAAERGCSVPDGPDWPISRRSLVVSIEITGVGATPPMSCEQARAIRQPLNGTEMKGREP
jgi:hypothetical protein